MCGRGGLGAQTGGRHSGADNRGDEGAGQDGRSRSGQAHGCRAPTMLVVGVLAAFVERGGERERESESESERARERESERARERESESARGRGRQKERASGGGRKERRRAGERVCQLLVFSNVTRIHNKQAQHKRDFIHHARTRARTHTVKVLTLSSAAAGGRVIKERKKNQDEVFPCVLISRTPGNGALLCR